MAKKKDQNKKHDISNQNFQAGCKIVSEHPIFVYLYDKANIVKQEHSNVPQDGLAIVMQTGEIHAHPTRRAEPAIWARGIAHCLLHLALGHFVEKENPFFWNVACDCAIEKFLSDLKFGKSLNDGFLPSGINDENRLYTRFLENGLGKEYVGFGTSTEKSRDMFFVDKNPSHSRYYGRNKMNWSAAFAEGLALAVKSAVDVAAGEIDCISFEKGKNILTNAQIARRWFISSYPLLGAIAANFKIIEDPNVCQRMEVSIAAISCYLQEIYINPAANLSQSECRFVMAHEFLHAALSHDARQEWRDDYLWNVACDYVINMWLTEMGVGERPDGLLYDEQFKGINAESIYDRIVTDTRTYRKLATLRGVGLGDILPGSAKWWTRGDSVDLDAFYHRAIEQGLSYHQDAGRGYLPEGLIEEIRALSHPPIPWDVELARWFDEMFIPIEKIRSYARLSRRQSSTPDIPRASYIVNQEILNGRTFGVILDTSGSMSRGMLAVCLGAIASYSMAREVQGVRVVFCDAAAYDQGYMKPEDIASTVKVMGRGGTVLQPAIDLLDRMEDFPKGAPILVITDGYCENRLMFKGREHGFLIPIGNSLPFVPRGKVFRIRE